MIRLNNIHKKYNTGKRNEIHVLNNISLQFENKGLVCLLGPSGSGKTTLLNAIGGLDKVDSGTINFDGVEMNRYSFSKWDTLRRKNIGFIFQNYLLLPDLSVYENVRFSLRLSDLPEEKVNERVEYALKAVKMDKFKRRKARNLSGGQQQRVAIARALVTSPNVIIADEPTGNLDAVNSMQIMNIIKKISEECLVILVTHNRNLASLYADRIIELQDGKIIKDYQNSSSDNLQFTHDQNIYLQDLKVDNITDQDLNISYFYEQRRKPVDIKLIYKDNTIYISANGENVEFKLLTPADEVKLIDGKKSEVSKVNIEDFDYYLEKLPPTKTKSRAIISLKNIFILAYKRLNSLRKFQKFLLSGLVLTAILTVISISTFLGIRKFDLKQQLGVHQDLIAVESNLYNDDIYKFIDDLQTLKGQGGIIQFTNQGSNTGIKYIYDLFFQIPEFDRDVYLYGSLINIDQVDESKLILGRMPQAKNEILLDSMVLDQIIENTSYSSMGLVNYKYFINKKFTYYNLSGTIVGVVSTNNQAIYLDEDLMLSGFLKSGIVEELGDSYQTNYDKELQDNEVLVNEKVLDNIKSTVDLQGLTYNVVGSFTSNNPNIYFVINKKAAEKLFIYEQIGTRNLAILSSNKAQTINYLEQHEDLDSYTFNVFDLYQEQLRAYRRENALVISTQTIFSVITLAGSLLFLYFIIRSSMISRIYEIGVFRALGVPRREIYKIFGSEITLITLFTTAIGWGIISYIFLTSKGNLPMLRIYYNLPLAILILFGLWIVNLIVGLLPVYGLLRKTPAEILSKYDI